MSESSPDWRPPPRDVHPWTKVLGHVVVDRESRPFCQCGWRAAPDERSAAVAAHLRDAWPELFPRLDGEEWDAFRSRLIAERLLLEERYVELAADADREPIPPGGAFPVVSEGELADVEDQLAVITHQIEVVDHKLRREP